MSRILLVRHGENPANLTKEFSYRKVDYSLTEKGRLQARQTASFLAGVTADRIWSSPLQRASETADEIAQSQGVPVQILEDLREMNVGDLEGMNPVEPAWAIYAETMRQWLGGNPDHRFPQGESRRELCQRFRGVLEQSLQTGAETVVLVGHGGLFTHGVAEVCGIEDQRAFFRQPNHNCSISTLEATREASRWRFVLVDWASVAHLSGEASRVIDGVPESAQVKNL